MLRLGKATGEMPTMSAVSGIKPENKMNEDLDALIEELGFGQDAAVQITKEVSPGTSYDSRVAEILKQLYIAMRNKGYAHQELTS